MKTTTILVASVLTLVLCSGPAAAASFVIVNGDSAGEGLNDPTPVTPVGGNTGTTLGAQRLIVLEAVADVWAARLDSPVDIRILARFDPMGNCGVLGSTGPGTAFMNFPGAPVANVYFHSAIADSITGTDQDPGGADFYITYNSDWDTAACPTTSFYYGLDGNEPLGTEDLFPVVLHEMGHGLGFASFVNPSNGVFFFGAPGIFDYYLYDVTAGLHWSEMSSSAQRQASAVNTGNLVWDGPNATAEVPDTLYGSQMNLEMTAPPSVAGNYAAAGAIFGEVQNDPISFSGAIELVNTGSATPTDGCDPLIGFTPGNIAFIDRGACEFGVKGLNAQNAGASAAIIANDRDGTTLVNMAGGVVGGQVTIPVVALGQNDGNLIRPQLPGAGVVSLLARWGMHDQGYALMYAPGVVEPGSSVSHFDVTAWPDLLMEPFTSEDVFDQLDLTPAQLEDVGHTLIGVAAVFADGFENGDTTAWSSTVP